MKHKLYSHLSGDVKCAVSSRCPSVMGRVVNRGPKSIERTAQDSGTNGNVAIFGENGDDQFRPDVVSDAAGTLYLVWVENFYDGGFFNQMRFASGSPEMIGSSSIEIVSGYIPVNVDQPQPVIALDPVTNDLYVAWLEGGNGQGYDIYVRQRQRGLP